VFIVSRFLLTQMDPNRFSATPANLDLINRITAPLYGQQPPTQQPIQAAPSDMAYGLPMSMQTQPQIDENHNKNVQYVWEQQMKYGFDPIEYDGPPTCFSRERRIACSKIFNMNSDRLIGVFGHLLNALGAAGVALTIAFEVMWMFNGKSANEYDFTYLMNNRNSAPNWWIPFPGLFGYACFFAAHVLYLIGGAIIPSSFLLICDLAGVGGGIVLEFTANNATNRMIGVGLTMGPLPFLSLVLFLILAARDPRYAYVPPIGVPPQTPGTASVLTPEQAAMAPRMAGVPLYSTSGPIGAQLASANGYQPQMQGMPMQVRTGSKKSRKAKG
jgi:hypothetical protein